MSADLFAEFGAESSSNEAQQHSLQPPSRPGIQQTSSYAFFDGWSATTAAAPALQPASRSPVADSWSASQTSVQHVVDNDNDEWGDFEGGSSFEPIAPPQQGPFTAVVASLASPPPDDNWSTTPTTLESYGSGFGQQSLSPRGQSSWQRAPIVKAKMSADPSVLFDAEHDHGSDDDDDEFGEFESTEKSNVMSSNVSAKPSSALVDLLGDLNVSQPVTSAIGETKNTPHSRPQSKSLFSAQQKPLSLSGTATKPRNPAVAPIAAKKDQDEAGWDTFDDWEQSIPGAVVAKQADRLEPARSASTAAPSITPIPILALTTDDPRPGELPPTNVPPPGVLLSMFPSLFNDAQEKLFKPMAAQSLTIRNRLLAEAATITYLAGYLVVANVAAHIIAGRKLRWKRDQHLSQGMRIGPASSRATSGMKLTGIDKGENQKEEREVADVVRVWKEHVGRLRHVVSGANQIKVGTLGPVPDLQEVMPVRTLKQSEGGVPARQPCMLCGLKREERVTAADLATDDSFGEWWIDQVNMHRGCRNFWNKHKDTLRQR